MSHSSESNIPPFSKPVRVLVVDDDTTCLLIVDAMLKKWKYEVVAVKRPEDALCILRMNSDSFDLVVLDVHMPEINGFELQELISEEFDLPVVLMSADNKEAVVLKGIEGGAVFFLSKPIAPDVLKDLWQFAAVSKKTNKATCNKTDYGKGKSIAVADNIDSSAVNGDYQQIIAKEIKRNYMKKEKLDDSKEEGNNVNVFASTPRKAKVVWTSELHNRFLEAINNIGLERAVPKKILEEMNVPGLTRENVASHLQKYRIFLKRMADASPVDYSREKSLCDRFFRSTFMSRNPTLTFNKLQQPQMRTFFSRGYERYAPAKDPSNIGLVPFPILETSSNNLIGQSAQGVRTPLLSTQDISMQMYQPTTETIPKRLTSGLDSIFDLAKPKVGNSAYVTAGTSSNSNFMQNTNAFNHVAIKMANGHEQTAKLGREIGFSSASNDFILRKGLVNNWINQNDNLNASPTNLWTGGEIDVCGVFRSIMNNSTASTPNMILHQAQPFDSGINGLSSASTCQVAIQSQNQISKTDLEQHGDDDDADFWSSLDSFHIGDDILPLNQPFTSTEQQQVAEPMVISSSSITGMNQPDASVPWIDQNSGQRDDEEILKSMFGAGPYDAADISSFGEQVIQTKKTF